MRTVRARGVLLIETLYKRKSHRKQRDEVKFTRRRDR